MSWNDSFNLVLRLAEPDVLRLSKRKQEIFLNDISQSLELPRLQITHLGFLFVMFSFQIHQKTLFIFDLALHIHEDSDDKVEQPQWLHKINQPRYFSVNIQETNCLFNTWIPVRHVAQTTVLLWSRYFPYFSPLFLSTNILVEHLLLWIKIFPVRKQRTQKTL